MNWDDFAPWGRRVADWAQHYRQTVGDRPVRAQTQPGAVLDALPPAPPESPQDMEVVFRDFEEIVMPGITHWQHPRFFAYFSSNAAAPSVLAEFLVSAIAPQCMLWQTSPAATEMETRMMDWLRQHVLRRHMFNMFGNLRGASQRPAVIFKDCAYAPGPSKLSHD